MRADNLQWRVATTVTTVIGIDAVQVEERMETIGGPTLFARIDHRNVNVKSCKNLSMNAMNAILKTFFNVAHLLNLDLSTTDESSVVNGHLSTFSLIFVICLILCATSSGIGLNCCSQFINACNKKCKQGSQRISIMLVQSKGELNNGKAAATRTKTMGGRLSLANLGFFFNVIFYSGSMIAHTSADMAVDAKRNVYPSRLESVVASDSLVPPVLNQVRKLINRMRLTFNYPLTTAVKVVIYFSLFECIAASQEATIVTTGTCKEVGLVVITDSTACATAANLLGLSASGSYANRPWPGSYNAEDLPPGCSPWVYHNNANSQCLDFNSNLKSYQSCGARNIHGTLGLFTMDCICVNQTDEKLRGSYAPAWSRYKDDNAMSTNLDQPPAPRYSHTATVLSNGTLVMIGGSWEGGGADDAEYLWSSSDDGRTWSKHKGAWARTSSWERPSLVVLKGPPETLIFHESLDLYATWASTDGGATWSKSEITGGLQARGSQAVVLGDDSLLLVSGHLKGYSAGDTLPNDAWISSDAGQSWKLQSDNVFPTSKGRNNKAMVVLPANGVTEETVYIFGGKLKAVNDCTNEVWSSVDRGVSWQLTPQPQSGQIWAARVGLGAVAIGGNTLVVFGGLSYSPTTRYNDIWVSNDRATSWFQKQETAPWTGRQAMAYVFRPTDGTLFVLGGNDGSRFRDGLNDVWRIRGGGECWWSSEAVSTRSRIHSTACIDLPGAPKKVEVRVAGDNALSVAIEPPDDDGGANITHYNVSFAKSLKQCDQLLSKVGDGWELVRSLKPGATSWHAATDNLAGTDVYGSPSTGIKGSWSIDFATAVPNYDQFLFLVGHCETWLMTTVASAIGGNYADAARNIIKSSVSVVPYTAKWYNRNGNAEDPLISTTDHHSGPSSWVYIENSQAGFCSWSNNHGLLDNELLCNDGTKCSGILDGWACCNGHGERAKCPPNWKYMCNGPTSTGVAHACLNSCTNYGGERPCNKTTYSPAWAYGAYVYIRKVPSIAIPVHQVLDVDATAFTLTVPNADTTAYATIAKSCNSLGCSTDFATDATTVPHKPKSVEVRVAGDSALSVAIVPPNDDGGANITHYQATFTYEYPTYFQIRHECSGCDGKLWSYKEVVADTGNSLQSLAAFSGKRLLLNLDESAIVLTFVLNEGTLVVVAPAEVADMVVARTTGAEPGGNRLILLPSGSANVITGVHFEVSGMLAWASGHLLNQGGVKVVLANNNYLIAYGAHLAEERVFYQRSPPEDIVRFINATGADKEIVPFTGAATNPVTMDLVACNSFGCSTTSTTDTTAPPCHPPHTYLKDNLCWACPPGSSSTTTNATECTYHVNVLPTFLTTNTMLGTPPTPPFFQIAGTVPRNMSDGFQNTTFAKITIYHIVSARSKQMLPDNLPSEGERSFVEEPLKVLATGTTTPLVWTNWTFSKNITLLTNQYAGIIIYRIEVQACVGGISANKCGLPSSIDTQLINIPISAPAPPMVTNFAAFPTVKNGFSLNITWAPSEFKGTNVPLNSTNCTYNLQQKDMAFSTNWTTVQTLYAPTNTSWTTPNDLWGKSLTSYKYRIQSQYYDVYGNYSDQSPFSTASENKTVASDVISAPTILTVQPTENKDYSLNITWAPSEFKGRYVPLTSTNCTYIIQQKDMTFSTNWTTVQTLHAPANTSWQTPNGLLGSQITSYKYRIQSQYYNIYGNYSDESPFSTVAEISESEGYTVTLIATRPELKSNLNQVPTSDNSVLSFKVSTNGWTGAPIINYTLHWIARQKCGATDPRSAIPKDVKGIGIVDAPTAAANEPFTVIIPALLAPLTEYHVLVEARVMLGREDDDKYYLSSTTPVEGTFQTKLGAVNITIHSTGNDTLCGNRTAGSTVYPACKTIQGAMANHPFESFEYIVRPGTYDLPKPLDFVAKFMKIYSINNDFNVTKLKCTTRCLDLNIETGKHVPELIKGLHFISTAAALPNTTSVEKGGAIRLANFQSSRHEPGSIYFDMTIESCVFEGFAALHEGGAISVINVRARLKFNHLIFQNNTALETYGGAMSIDTSTDVVMNNIRCIENYAKEFGGCLSVTSNSDDGAPSSVEVSQLHSMKDVSDRRGGSVYIGRSSLLIMTNSTTKDAMGAGAIYVSAAKVLLLKFWYLTVHVQLTVRQSCVCQVI